MKKPLLALVSVFTLAFGLLILASTAGSATAFTVSPWAYACGETHYGNPAANVDVPSEGKCGANDVAGTSAAVYTDGVLTLTKTGDTLKTDAAAGATIGGLDSLSAASVDCMTTETCNPGGNLRLNLVDSAGALHFVGAASDMDSSGHINFALKDANSGESLVGVQLKSIDIMIDNSSVVSVKNLAFEGAATPTPAPTPSGPSLTIIRQACVVRGHRETISIHSEPSVNLKIAVTYTGGGHPEDTEFKTSGTTDDAGNFTEAWDVASNARTGPATVDVTATGSNEATTHKTATFTIADAATGCVVTGPTPTPVPNTVTLAQTGDGIPGWPIAVLFGFVLLSIGTFMIRRRI